jgi:hypothetical protein
MTDVCQKQDLIEKLLWVEMRVSAAAVQQQKKMSV